MDECVPFNPLDKESLAVSIERALLAEEPHALGEINKFAGAGIYALVRILLISCFPRSTTVSLPFRSMSERRIPKGSERADT